MNRKKILMLSDSIFTTTGYSTQTLFLLNGLNKKGYECHLMCHTFIGQTLPKGCVKLADGTPLNFSLYGASREPYCKDTIVKRIREIKPDYFIILLDTFMLYPWVLQMDLAPAKTVFWFPSDGMRFPIGCEQVLQKMTKLVAMSKYGQKQVKDLFNIEANHIPHAVDYNIFSPMTKEEREQLKIKWDLQDKFVVGLVGRNQGRKFHDKIFKAFAKWSRTHQDAILLIHADPEDIARTFDMSRYAHQLGIANRIRFTGMKYYNSFTYEQMREVYNLFDVYASSTSGEGFGICTIDAMSCEVPVVITDFTTSEELVTENKSGETIKLVGTEQVSFFDKRCDEYDKLVSNGVIMGTWEVERGLMCIDDFCVKMDKLYDNPKLREEYGKNGRKAVLEKYNWKIVIDSWVKLLENL